MCIRCELLLFELVKCLSVLSARVRPTGETMDHYRDADVDRAQNGANLRRVSQVSEWDKRACVEGSWGGSARWPAVVSRETTAGQRALPPQEPSTHARLSHSDT